MCRLYNKKILVILRIISAITLIAFISPDIALGINSATEYYTLAPPLSSSSLARVVNGIHSDIDFNLKITGNENDQWRLQQMFIQKMEETDVWKAISEAAYFSSSVKELLENSYDACMDIMLETGNEFHGKVSIDMYHDGNKVVVEITDNGKTIDLGDDGMPAPRHRNEWYFGKAHAAILAGEIKQMEETAQMEWFPLSVGTKTRLTVTRKDMDKWNVMRDGTKRVPEEARIVIEEAHPAISKNWVIAEGALIIGQALLLQLSKYTLKDQLVAYLAERHLSAPDCDLDSIDEIKNGDKITAFTIPMKLRPGKYELMRYSLIDAGSAIFAIDLGDGSRVYISPVASSKVNDGYDLDNDPRAQYYRSIVEGLNAVIEGEPMVCHSKSILLREILDEIGIRSVVIKKDFHKSGRHYFVLTEDGYILETMDPKGLAGVSMITGEKVVLTDIAQQEKPIIAFKKDSKYGTKFYFDPDLGKVDIYSEKGRKEAISHISQRTDIPSIIASVKHMILNAGEKGDPDSVDATGGEDKDNGPGAMDSKDIETIRKLRTKLRELFITFENEDWETFELRGEEVLAVLRSAPEGSPLDRYLRQFRVRDFNDTVNLDFPNHIGGLIGLMSLEVSDDLKDEFSEAVVEAKELLRASISEAQDRLDRFLVIYEPENKWAPFECDERIEYYEHVIDSAKLSIDMDFVGCYSFAIILKEILAEVGIDSDVMRKGLDGMDGFAEHYFVLTEDDYVLDGYDPGFLASTSKSTGKFVAINKMLKEFKGKLVMPAGAPPARDFYLSQDIGVTEVYPEDKLALARKALDVRLNMPQILYLAVKLILHSNKKSIKKNTDTEPLIKAAISAKEAVSGQGACREHSMELARLLIKQGFNARVMKHNDHVHFWVEAEGYLIDAYPEGMPAEYTNLAALKGDIRYLVARKDDVAVANLYKGYEEKELTKEAQSNAKDEENYYIKERWKVSDLLEATIRDLRYQALTEKEIDAHESVIYFRGKLEELKGKILKVRESKNVRFDAPVSPEKERVHSVLFSDTVKLIQAKQQKSPLIVALGTSWIKGYDGAKGLQHEALNPLISRLRSYCKDKGILFVDACDASLAGVISEMRSENTGSRVIVLAGEETVKSNDFRHLREDIRVLLAGVDNKNMTDASYVRLMEMLTISFRVAFGHPIDDSNTDLDLIVDNGFILFIPKAEPLEYEDLKAVYKVQIFA